MSYSRGSGIFVLGFGLVLYFVAIPYDTEIVDYGWMRPQTLPNILAWILMASGIAIACINSDQNDHNIRQLFKAFMYLAIVVLGVILMDNFGFVKVSPALALVLMWLIGERRIFWLVSGVVGIPFLIWLVVVVLLERLLP